MAKTYTQVALHVDLTVGTTWREDIGTELVKSLLGGRGIGAKMLWDVAVKGIDPLSPENVLVFAAGTLTGTNAPCASRTSVMTKGALTGVFLKTNAGGHFGVALRMAGYDYLVVHGAAQRPVYLTISRDRVELRDAEMLWGRGVRDTTRSLQEELGRDVEVGCIGPAGESRVKFASIMFSYYCAAGRGGSGAVMGAKNLKAIAVDGTGGAVRVARPEEFRAAVTRARDAVYADTLAKQLYSFGTAADVDFFNELHASPAFNWQRSFIDDPEGAKRLGGRSWPERGYLRRRRGCSACTIGCHRFTEVDQGPYAGTYSGGPQLETVNAASIRCGHTNVELVLKYNELCNDMGLDTSSTGSAIAWIMETYDRGLLTEKDLGAIRPTWGSEEAILSLVHAIVRREGIGALLAEGTHYASRQVGGDSWKWTMQVKGMEPTALELRGAYGYALAFAVNSRGPDHLLTETIAEFGGTPEARAVIKKITGSEKYASGILTEKRAEIVRWHEDIYAVSDALGLCAFTTTATYGIDEEKCAALFSAATGIPIAAEEIMKAGRRIVTLERCFNMREGLGRKDDTLPYRFTHEVQADLQGQKDPLGRLHDPIVRPEQLDQMLDEYYASHGWDGKTGCPTRETLAELDLGFVADEL